jgi:hypothetical protein
MNVEVERICNEVAVAKSRHCSGIFREELRKTTQHIRISGVTSEPMSSRIRIWSVTTEIHAGRSRVRFPMRPLDFSIDLIFPAALLALGSTQPLIEMSTRSLPEGKGRPARGADNLTTICEPIV